MTFLAQLCNANQGLLESGAARVLPPIFQSCGIKGDFFGPVTTLKVFEDYVLVRELIESCPHGNGKVFVIDDRGRTRCSVIGDRLVYLAFLKGWSRIVVNESIFEIYEVNKYEFGIRAALWSNPMKGKKNGDGELHVPVFIGAVEIRDGGWLCADNDGILISEKDSGSCEGDAEREETGNLWEQERQRR